MERPDAHYSDRVFLSENRGEVSVARSVTCVIAPLILPGRSCHLLERQLVNDGTHTGLRLGLHRAVGHKLVRGHSTQ